VQRTFGLLKDGQYGGNLYRIATTKCPWRDVAPGRRQSESYLVVGEAMGQSLYNPSARGNSMSNYPESFGCKRKNTIGWPLKFEELARRLPHSAKHTEREQELESCPRRPGRRLPLPKGRVGRSFGKERRLFLCVANGCSLQPGEGRSLLHKGHDGQE
jgi:hypothetical protein